MAKLKFNHSTLKNAAQALMDEGVLDKEMFDPKNKHAAPDFLKLCLENYVDNVTEGYRWLLQEARGRWGPKRAEQFMIEDSVLQAWGDMEQAKQFTESAGAMKDVLHYSEDTVRAMFELVQDLMEQEKWEAAGHILLFLVYLDPYQAYFWEALGQCWQAQEAWDAANFAYGNAVNCDPTNPDLYRSFCNCFLAQNEKQKAATLLEYGIQQMRAAPKGRKMTEGVEDLEAALAYVQSIGRKR